MCIVHVWFCQIACVRIVISVLRKEMDKWNDGGNDGGDNASSGGNATENSCEERRKIMMLGERPNGEKGVGHKLMQMVWDGNIGGIHGRMIKEEVIVFFYTECVARIVGKIKWNRFMGSYFSTDLGDLVTVSDVAFTMVVLENILPRLMDEVEKPDAIDKSGFRKYQYTWCSDVRKKRKRAGSVVVGRRRKWNKVGMKRFVALCKDVQYHRRLGMEGDVSSNGRDQTVDGCFTWGRVQKMVMVHEVGDGDSYGEQIGAGGDLCDEDEDYDETDRALGMMGVQIGDEWLDVGEDIELRDGVEDGTTIEEHAI